MIVLELTDSEAKVLETGLERFLIDMDREIARTDRKDYRISLERDERVLRDVVEQLKHPAS
ncbi:MAG: hypothetical protein A4E57_02698 [Syntrophorhabdaceae bacterium PtaU1.Bin034]|jgi:hypothetical protein|nr:MAG: hypothetical protein A4E57_02698 [Syntrophorhabdaceae bacterium PtaU1.Bin034]